MTDSRYITTTKTVGGSMGLRAMNFARRRAQKSIPNLRQLTKKDGLAQLGNYMGPGTDLEDAEKYGPINEVDAVSRIHDFQYKAISDNSHRLTNKQIADAVGEADQQMLNRLQRLPNTTMKRIAQVGIKAKTIGEKIVRHVPGNENYVFIPGNPGDPSKPEMQIPRPVKPSTTVVELIDEESEGPQDIPMPGGGFIRLGKGVYVNNKLVGRGIQLTNVELTFDEGLKALETLYGDKQIPESLLHDYVNDVKMLRTRIVQKLQKPEVVVKQRKRENVKEKLNELLKLELALEEREKEVLLYTPKSTFEKQAVGKIRKTLEKLGVSSTDLASLNNKKELIDKWVDMRQEQWLKDNIDDSSSNIHYKNLQDIVKEGSDYLNKRKANLETQVSNVDKEIEFVRKGLNVKLSDNSETKEQTAMIAKVSNPPNTTVKKNKNRKSGVEINPVTPKRPTKYSYSDALDTPITIPAVPSKPKFGPSPFAPGPSQKKSPLKATPGTVSNSFGVLTEDQYAEEIGSGVKRKTKKRKTYGIEY